MTYSAEVLADSPLAYWRLQNSSGNFNDQSGNGRTANSAGTVSYSAASLLLTDADTCVDFVNGYGQIADAAWMDTAAITVEAWIRLDAITGGGHVILDRWTNANGSFLLYVDGPTASLNFIFFTTAGGMGTPYTVASGNGTIATGVTYHCVATYDGTTARVYINGVEFANLAQSGTLRASSSGASFGKGRVGGSSINNYPLDGRMDEVAWYDHALSAARVEVHYSAGTVAAPGVPTSVAVDNVAATTADLEWSAPASGGPPTHYEVRLDGGTPVTATSPHEFTGLTPATASDFEVRAVNLSGASPWVLVSATTTASGPDVAYAAKIRIGAHFWDIEFGDPADAEGPEVLAGASYNWTAPDNVAWPPPMWTVPRDVCQLRVRCPDAAEVADVRRGDVVRFKFTPEGYDYAEPLVDFAGIVTGDPTMVDDPGGGVILQVAASDYRVLLSQASVEGETVIGVEAVDTAGDALVTLSDAIDLLNPGLFPGSFGDVTVDAVDPRGWLGGTLDHDVIVETDAVASALSLFASIGMVPVPVYDDDGDLDPVQPFRIVEPDPYGETYDTPPAITSAIIPNDSVMWKRDYIPDAVQTPGSLSAYLWMGGVPGDPLTATVFRTGSLDNFNEAGFSNMVPEAEPWSLYGFTVLGYLNPEAPRDWFIYPQRVQQYVTIDDAELVKNPAGDESVAGMLKGATLVVGARGRWVVHAGLRPHHFGTP